MRAVFLIVTVFTGCIGCGGRPSASQPSTAPPANLTFRDAAGGVAATANIQLPETFPAVGQTFKGTWQLISSTRAFPSASTRNGAYEGNVYDEWIAIDLNPGVSDSNVVFHWAPAFKPMSGPWYHATFTGGKRMGTFTITTE